MPAMVLTAMGMGRRWRGCCGLGAATGPMKTSCPCLSAARSKGAVEPGPEGLSRRGRGGAVGPGPLLAAGPRLGVGPAVRRGLPADPALLARASSLLLCARAWPREPDPGGSAGPGRVRLCAREHAVAARPPKGLSQGSTSQRRESPGPGPSQTPPVQPGSELTGRKAETQPPSPGAGRRALSGSPGSAPSQRGPGLQLGSSARPSAPCRSAHLPFFPLGLPPRRSAAAGEPPPQPHPAREPGATESTGGGGQAGPGGRGGGPPWGVLTSSGASGPGYSWCGRAGASGASGARHRPGQG